MTKPLIQIGDEVREMTEAEIAAHRQCFDELAVIVAQREEALILQTEARKSAISKLAHLGLTEAEISALLGN